MERIIPSQEQACAAERLHALGNPLRVAMVSYIAAHPGCICNDLVVRFDRAQATISQHLAILRRAAIVDAERDGQATSYTLNRDVVAGLAGALHHLLALAPIGQTEPEERADIE